jgi:hypothetical protein
MTEWTEELELLTLIAERIGGVIQGLHAVAGSRSLPKFGPLPRPVSEPVERLLEQARRAAHDELVRRVLPQRA